MQCADQQPSSTLPALFFKIRGRPFHLPLLGLGREGSPRLSILGFSTAPSTLAGWSRMSTTASSESVGLEMTISTAYNPQHQGRLPKPRKACIDRASESPLMSNSSVDECWRAALSRDANQQLALWTRLIPGLLQKEGTSGSIRYCTSIAETPQGRRRGLGAKCTVWGALCRSREQGARKPPPLVQVQRRHWWTSYLA